MMAISRRSLVPLVASATFAGSRSLNGSGQVPGPPTIEYPTGIPVFLESVETPGVVLRIDGRPGAAVPVTCQSLVDEQRRALGRNAWEVVTLINNRDGTYSFRSNYFPARYLRMKNAVALGSTTGPDEKFTVGFVGGGNFGYDAVTVESVSTSGTYLHLLPGRNPAYNVNGYGSVGPLLGVGDTARFRVGGILRPAAETVMSWSSAARRPSSGQCDALIREMIQQPVGVAAVRSSAHAIGYPDGERSRLRALDNAPVSDLQQAVVVFLVDFLVLLTRITGITVTPGGSLSRAIASSPDLDWTAAEACIKVIADAGTPEERAQNAFQLVKILDIPGFWKTVTSRLVAGLPSKAAFVTAVSLTAHVRAWIYNHDGQSGADGNLFIVQLAQQLTGDSIVVDDAKVVKSRMK